RSPQRADDGGRALGSQISGANTARIRRGGVSGSVLGRSTSARSTITWRRGGRSDARSSVERLKLRFFVCNPSPERRKGTYSRRGTSHYYAGLFPSVTNGPAQRSFLCRFGQCQCAWGCDHQRRAGAKVLAKRRSAWKAHYF